jgi:hypothetical protein
MPIATVAGQSGSFDAEDRADLAATDFGDQSLKPRTLHQPGPRAAQIVINNDDISKAQLVSTIHKAILPELAFVVVHHLADR